MKKSIHPTYHAKAKITCSCTNYKEVISEAGSVSPEIKVDVCYKCHPFYTGKKNLIDTAGRVEKFKARQEKAEALKNKTKE